MKTIDFQGMKIRIDRPKGFEQTGVGEDGKPWKRVYHYNYGFLPRTKGGDGDGVDVFIGPKEDAHTAFWAIQKDKNGKFDEYKVFVGFPDRASARKAYLQHIPARFLGGIAAMSIQMMKALLGYEPFEKLAAALPPGSLLEQAAFILSFNESLGDGLPEVPWV